MAESNGGNGGKRLHQLDVMEIASKVCYSKVVWKSLTYTEFSPSRAHLASGRTSVQ